MRMGIGDWVASQTIRCWFFWSQSATIPRFSMAAAAREARRGYDVARIEMNQVFRRIRTPEQVAKGKELLGPAKRTRAQDGSCRVKIIRDMIADDAKRRGAVDD